MSERVTKAIHYAILTIIAIIFVLPLVWLILAAFDLNASQALKWPSQWTLSNFTSVLTNTDNPEPARPWGGSYDVPESVADCCTGIWFGSVSSVQISSDI